MNSLGLSPKSAATRLLLAAGALTALAPVVNAAVPTPKHKYTFRGNADDSLGGMNGEVIDNTGISKYTGGALDLSANNNAGSAQDFSMTTTVGAYVDLPNGIFTGAVSSGDVFGAVTLEVWATPQENRNWARLVDFGTSNGGEDVSGSGSTSNYVIMVPQSDRGGHAIASAHSSAGGEGFAEAGFGLPAGVKSHMVAVYDQTDITGGPNGTLTLYINNGAPITAAIPDGMQLDIINDNNNWLGRAQWGDPLFDGLIDEFRIYDVPLTAANVAESFAAGPESRSDLNGDGLVTVADWNLFFPNSAKTFAADTDFAAYLKGDLDGDKDNDYSDFKLFKADFIAANGEAAFASLAAAVPEPTSAVLGALGATLAIACRRGRRQG